MTTEPQPFPHLPLDPFGNPPTGLGPPQATFRTSAELAALMARLPTDTPVILTGDRKAENLDIDSQPHHTVTVAELVAIADPDAITAAEAGHDIGDRNRFRQAVQLGTVVLADGAPGLPYLTVPLLPYERAAEALIETDITTAVRAQVDLLRWIVDALIDEPDVTRDQPGLENPHDDDLDDAARTVAHWIDDPALKAALRIEAGQLRHTAGRLAALAARITDNEAVAGIIGLAEELIEVAADDPDPAEDPDCDDDPPT